MSKGVISIFGGTGFVGRYVVRALVKEGYTVKVISRNPDLGKVAKPAGNVGQVVLYAANIRNEKSIRDAVRNSDAVINLVGILHEEKGQRFSAIHAQGAERLAKIALESGVKRFIHMSSLGVNHSERSKYARTKMMGEKAVSSAFPYATILRPSIIFGPEDSFFNRFGAMAKLSPFLPLIGGGKTRFQPVYVADVAEAIVQILKTRTSTGKIYELGGPRIYSFKELLEYTVHTLGVGTGFLPLPFPLASILGRCMEWLPSPPLTSDQVTLLKYDNIVSDDAIGFKELGISPTPLESVVPYYLS